MARGLRSHRTVMVAVAGCAMVLAFATACGGSSNAGPPSAHTGPASGGTPVSPGASGTIASVTAGSLEVQNPQDGQTTVTFSSGTPILSEEAGSLADVTVGSCVVVASASVAKPDAPISATAVAISPAGSTGCVGQGAFGRPGGQGSANDHAPGSSSRSAAPRSKTRGSGKFVRPTIGQVIALGGQGFTVSSIRHGSSVAPAPESKRAATPSSTSKPSTTSVQVTTSSATKFTETVPANAAALIVGKCLMATGKADDTGAVTATVLRVSEPGPSGCGSHIGAGRSGAPQADGNG